VCGRTFAIRGLPFDEPDRIISLGTEDARGRDLGVSKLDFLDWRDSSRSFRGLTLMLPAPMNVSEESRVMPSPRIPSRSARRRSGCGWRWAPNGSRSCGWCCGARAEWSGR